MADNNPSSNPFRRKGPASEPPANSNHAPNTMQRSMPPLDTSNILSSDAPKKASKKVRVQSPPPPSPSTSSIPDSASTVGEDIFTKATSPTTFQPDPFRNSELGSSKSETTTIPRHVPANPFSRTLETLEHPEREGATPISSTANAGRPALDVNAFQRLLMTGDAGLGVTPTVSQAHHSLEDRGSSTNTSSLLRQSVTEPVHEVQYGSPHTSHEVVDDERRGREVVNYSVTSNRKPPPPPSSKHGKLIKVELRDETSPPIALGSPQPPTPSSFNSQQYFTYSSASNPSTTDLNKPLPPAPDRTSHESDRESIFDKESAGKTPEPPSPSTSVRRKVPPAPPISRRHSQQVTDTKVIRDTGRLSPKVEEDGDPYLRELNLTRRKSIAVGELGSSGGKAPPPPPPSRKVGSVRRPHTELQQNHLVSSSTVSLPPTPPPARNSSRSTSGGRPASVLSFDMTTSKRTSMAPPPPPPRHHGHASMDGDGTYLTGEEGRRVSGESGRSIQKLPERESSIGIGGVDILADIAKLQLEIEAAAKHQGGSNVS